MTPVETVLIVALVAMPLVSTATTVVLVRAARRPPAIPALTERTTVAVLSSIGGWIIALLAANRLGGWIELERPWSTLLVIGALLLFSAPAPIFLWAYWTGRLRD